MQGDESYGSNEGYYLLMRQIALTFGKDWRPASQCPQSVFIFHQGRAAEHALFSSIGKLGNDLIIPSNGHFDTTSANIEANHIEAVNCFSSQLRRDIDHPFKGDMDLERLERLCRDDGDRIPMIYLTITNNTGGGQPVSMDSIKATSRIAKKHDIPLFFDACRFAENAYFIKTRDRRYRDVPLTSIVKKMFSYVDAFTVSWKKDGISNMGGSLVIKQKGLFARKHPELLERITDHQILTEGHPTYGGLTGRDLKALAVGISRVTDVRYLHHRISQVRRFGQRVSALGVPVLKPFGGHALYLDMNLFFRGTGKAKEEFPGIALTALLLGSYGHRLCELGDFAFGCIRNEKHVFPEVNYVRAAVPRLMYEDQDLLACAQAIGALHKRRKELPGVEVTSGIGKSLRHFKARFKFK